MNEYSTIELLLFYYYYTDNLDLITSKNIRQDYETILDEIERKVYNMNDLYYKVSRKLY